MSRFYYGRVTPPLAERFLLRVSIQAKGCWIWRSSRSRYPSGLSSRGRYEQGHRIAYQIFIGSVPRGSFVLHKCDNTRCVRPSHLFLGNHKDNMADMCAKKRQQHGSRHWNARLDAKIVSDIRAAYASGRWTQRELASRHGIAQASVSKIVLGKTWAS